MLERRIVFLFALLFVAIFAGRVGAQSASLDQAKSIYANAASNGGAERASLEMARARASIDAADSAIANGHDRATADAMATQALHDAQAAEAANSRIHDRQVADSLHAYRLTQRCRNGSAMSSSSRTSSRTRRSSICARRTCSPSRSRIRFACSSIR